jgi:hypothetical protein
MTSLATKLNALATMSSAALRAEWRRVYRAPAPALSSDLLARGIAYRLQEKESGRLEPALERELVRLAASETRSQPCSPVATSLRPGTTLARTWNGESHRVLVAEDGYQYNNESYASLSRIAHVITGTKWSGPRFFGLGGSARVRGTSDGK